MRDGNRRKGEKKKMNRKPIATIILAILLISTFGGLGSLISVRGVTYYTLAMTYAPKPMLGSVVPALAPPVGSDQYTDGSVINITAPAIVSAGTGIRYVFDNWTLYQGPYQNVSYYCTATNPFYGVTMDQNHTAVAMYHLEYLLTFVSPYDTAWIWDGSGWQTNGNGSIALWFDADTIGVGVGLTTGQVVVGPGHIAEFDHWIGDVSGNYTLPITDPQHSPLFNMTGPKTCGAAWLEYYYLWTDSVFSPWGSGYDPDQEGYYAPNTDVYLTAPAYDQINPGNWRWRFDYWEVSNYNGTAWNVVQTLHTQNITVHMDQIKYAVVHYWLQYYLTVATSPSTVPSGVESQSGYFDYGSNVTLTAPQYVADPSDTGARWKFKQWYIAGVIDWYNTVLTVTIGPGWNKIAYAIYTKQYYITIKTSPPSILGMAGIQFTGQGWYDDGASWTVTALNTTIMVDSNTKWVFVDWDFTECGGSAHLPNPVTYVADRAWNGTAIYKKQYRATYVCDPTLTGYVNLNVWNGWGAAGGEMWADENSLVYWAAGSGPVAGYPADFYFDHWTVNSVDQTQYMNAFNLNFTGPKTTVAHYLAHSAFFMTPQTVMKNVPAYCTTFDVNVTAANLVDLYGVDFNVTWDKNLLELVNVQTYVNEIWNTYYIAINDVSILGNYHLVATALAPTKGFNGTHAIVKLTFHVIFDPCYVAPFYANTPINMIVNLLSDSTGAAMMPWNVHGSDYTIYAMKPVMYLKPSAVNISQKDATFSVEVWIANATKMTDYEADVLYDKTLLTATNVVIDDAFLTGPHDIHGYGIYSGAFGWVNIVVKQGAAATPVNGEGRLATIYFKVIKTIFWTTANPMLTCPIAFAYYAGQIPGFGSAYTQVSTTCGIIADPNLGHLDCVYKYKPIPGDVNMDGVVNVLDLQLVAADYGSSTTYDLNVDTKVNLLDIVLVAINYGRTTP